MIFDEEIWWIAYLNQRVQEISGGTVRRDRDNDDFRIAAEREMSGAANSGETANTSRTRVGNDSFYLVDRFSFILRDAPLLFSLSAMEHGRKKINDYWWGRGN